MRHMPWMVACALATAVAGSAGAGLVGYWHCNDIDPAVSTVIAASQGGGMLDFTSFGTGATVFGGTDMNAQPTILAGDSLGLTGVSHNGAFAQLDISTIGFSDLTMSFAARRSTTGFGNSRVDALIGGAWTTVTTFNALTTAWGMVTIDLSSLDSLENGFASLRLVFDGASSGSGTVRFDNLTINGTVPAPGAIVLLGAAGAMGRRRRSRA